MYGMHEIKGRSSRRRQRECPHKGALKVSSRKSILSKIMGKDQDRNLQHDRDGVQN
jgi:hypothetical protein